MKVAFIDKLNIALIIISAILAYFFPLRLFIFAYAILGPLHYLTEINWLNDRKYYFSDKRWIWLWVGLIVTFVLVVPKWILEFSNPDLVISKIMLWINAWSNSVIFLSIVLATAYYFIKAKWIWWPVVILGIIGAYFLNSVELYAMLVGLFVPTIIHVYLFTLLFMLYGARKAKSKTGYWAFIIGAMAPIFFVVLPVSSNLYEFPQVFKTIYLENNFHVAPVIFSKYLGISEGKTFFFYESMELRLMMFMSFIYCYHYLNWFSKTTVIQWHKFLTIKKTIIILVFWLLCITLFYVDFRVGFLFSLFLSFLHVVLEFPLNVLSVKSLLSVNRA